MCQKRVITIFLHSNYIMMNKEIKYEFVNAVEKNVSVGQKVKVKRFHYGQ